MIVAAFDPGTATTGFAVVKKTARETLEALDFGVIRTSPEDGAPERLRQIHADVETLLETYRPDTVATERLFFEKNVTTGIAVGRAIGVILLAVAERQLPWTEYTPLQVKQAVTGTGNADKKQVQYMVTRLLGLKETPRPDDAADALAVAICHAHSARLTSAGVRVR